MGEPQNGWLIKRNLTNWMIWGYPYFRKPLISHLRTVIVYQCLLMFVSIMNCPAIAE